jgi:predicted dehydrogenase
MKVYNIGIIGFGGFGKFLFNAWNQLDHVKVVAIADKNPAAFADIEGVNCFTNWNDLIASVEVELVAIVTDPSTHRVIAEACMSAGKHVLIEKPLAITTIDATEIIKTRDRTGTVAAIDFIMRFNPLLRAIQSLTQAGIFGKLRRADIENYAQDEQLPPEHWFWQRDRSGGILIEHAVHFIDLIHFLAPSPHLVVNGLKYNRDAVHEDQIIANVLYESGLIATHYHSFARPGFFESTSIKLSYDLADVQLHGWIPLSAEVNTLVNGVSKAVLLANPLFECLQVQAIKNVNDQSRPAGWGKFDRKSTEESLGIYSGGVPYEVDEQLSGRFVLNQTKQQVYVACVQSSLLDVLQKIDEPAHHLAATLESGLSSLEVAELATISARSNT